MRISIPNLLHAGKAFNTSKWSCQYLVNDHKVSKATSKFSHHLLPSVTVRLSQERGNESDDWHDQPHLTPPPSTVPPVTLPGDSRDQGEQEKTKDATTNNKLRLPVKSSLSSPLHPWLDSLLELCNEIHVVLFLIRIFQWSQKEFFCHKFGNQTLCKVAGVYLAGSTR